MKQVTLHTFPKPLSCLCLGTASMGESGLTGEPLDKAFAILDAYYAMGGRFLDTANVYGRWGVDITNASEIVLGKWLKERHIGDMVVTTKACHYMLEAHDISRVTKVDMDRDVEDSRQSLGMDTLDICLLHRDNESVDIRTIVDFCVAQVHAGHVTRFGFSNYRATRVVDAIRYMGDDWDRYFVGVSNEWSLAMAGATDYNPPDGMVPVDEALTAAQSTYDFGIIPFSSVAHGFFAKLVSCGALWENGTWTNTEHFRGNKNWLTAVNGEAFNLLKQKSTETGHSVNTLSLLWLMEKPATIPVMSVSRVSQLEELAGVLH